MLVSENNTEIVTKEFLVNNGNQETQFLAQRFSNRIFITISECNGFGSLINITKDELDVFTLENSKMSISVDFLIGVEEDIYKIIARQIAAAVFLETNLPILLAIALKDRSSKCLKDILNNLDKINVWRKV
nr:proteasome assembly chaperone 3-like [Hydra vulgaris]